MKTYIVLLRGINVSGKNKLSMASLRELLNGLGFENVQTYIQSGNIILKSENSKTLVCQKIQQAIKNKFGYDITVLARTAKELKKALTSYPFSVDNDKIVAFTFLEKTTSYNEIEGVLTSDDDYKIDGDVVYLYCPSGFGKTKLTNNTIEKKLQVAATTRNLKTTKKLVELATS